MSLEVRTPLNPPCFPPLFLASLLCCFLAVWAKIISLEWSSGDLTQIINWGTGSSDGVSYHNFYLQNQAEFTESDQIADWGNWYLSTASGNDVSCIALCFAAAREKGIANFEEYS